MDKRIMVLATEVHRQRAIQMLRDVPLDYVVEIKPKTRSLDQNAMLWACLTDVSQQVTYYGKKYRKEDWKHIFTGSLKGMEAVPAIGGGVVMLGQSTSVMNKQEFSDLIALIHSFGAEQGVQWSDDASAVYAQWLEAA